MKKTISRIAKWVSIIFLLVLIIFYGFYLYQNCYLWKEKDCIGLVGKTVWDIFDLIGVPLAIAILIYYLNKKEINKDREKSSDIQQESDLQEFTSLMNKMFQGNDINKLDPGNLNFKIARLKTISLFERLDHPRKGRLILLLGEIGLINAIDNSIPKISLKDHNLEKTNLSHSNLMGAHLYNSNLKQANLVWANLKKANLCGAHLDKADLSPAELTGAILKFAFLKKANLQMATLLEAHLEEAHLEGANLQGANLKSAYLEGAYLRGVLFEGATMPDGKEFDPTVHTLEMLTGRKSRSFSQVISKFFKVTLRDIFAFIVRILGIK